jgi:hypothetical protein
MKPLATARAVIKRLVRDDATAMRHIFGRIYRDNLWSVAETRSGPGSTLERTAQLRAELSSLVHELGIRTILDIPCGDFNWMRAAALDIDRYIGGDIVKALIVDNQRQYGNASRQFCVLDITRHKLPPADLVLCRDCLVHFTFDDIFKALRNIKRSRARYLLVTTFTDHPNNQDTVTGGWRTLDMQRAPFHFAAPERVIVEGRNPAYPDKCLGLWQLRDILY